MGCLMQGESNTEMFHYFHLASKQRARRKTRNLSYLYVSIIQIRFNLEETEKKPSNIHHKLTLRKYNKTYLIRLCTVDTRYIEVQGTDKILRDNRSSR